MYVFCKGRYASFLIALSFSSIAVRAQSKFYTLNALIDSATQHLPLFFERRAIVNSYKAMVTDARHSFLPD